MKLGVKHKLERSDGSHVGGQLKISDNHGFVGPAMFAYQWIPRNGLYDRQAIN